MSRFPRCCNNGDSLKKNKEYKDLLDSSVEKSAEEKELKGKRDRLRRELKAKDAEAMYAGKRCRPQ